MEIQIFENYEVLSQRVAEKIIEVVKQKPNALICLGSGDTPLGVFEVLVDKAKKHEVDFSKIHFVGLDEWLGMDETDVGSCFYTMFQKLFIQLKISENNIHCFNAKNENLAIECEKIDNLIDANHGLDLLLLGIGTNGHLAMNEPDTPFDVGCHVSKLAESTIATGQKYFNTATPLQLGITVGHRHIKGSKNIILMANGTKKAEIIQKTISANYSPEIPSTILQKVENVTVMLDADAAFLLK